MKRGFLFFIMNIYDLSRNFFNFSFENPEKIKPNHIAIYFFAVEHCNRLGWKQKFGFPTSMVLEATGIKSYSVYKKTFDELVEYNFFTVIEYSKNQYSSNIIALKENYKSNIKALDKALIKHTSKHKQCTCQRTDSINIQLYNITNLQCTNILSYVSDLKSDLIECFLNSIEVDDIKDFLEERKKVAPKKERNEEKPTMPDDFIEIWEEWKEYRKAKRFKSYAGLKWEQMAVDKLLELSNKNPTIAKLILKQTYENSYQGFFPLKQNSNGITNTTQSRFSNNGAVSNGKVSGRSIVADRISQHLARNSESGNHTIDIEANIVR